MKKKFSLFFEHILNHFGFYRLPRYYIYKIYEDGHESKFMYGQRNTVYKYYDMLDFISVLNSCTKNGMPIKYRIERIKHP